MKIIEDDGLFDVSPNVITGESGELSVRVKDSARLDYETTPKTTFKVLFSVLSPLLSTFLGPLIDPLTTSVSLAR